MATLSGFPYPIVKTPNGYFHPVKGVDAIKADLLQLLMTNPGERVMMPDFGCALRKLCFEPLDSILTQQARDIVIEALTKWEPRIAVEEINITTDTDTDSLYIRILFRDPQNIENIEQLQLELPTGGAAI